MTKTNQTTMDAGVNMNLPTSPDNMLEGDMTMDGLPHEEKKLTYLDIVREEVSEKPTPVYTIIVVGELAKELDRAEFSTYYQRFFKKHQTETDLITGLLLVYRGTFLHLVEATQKVMYQFIRDIAAHPSFTPKTDPLDIGDINRQLQPVPMIPSSRILFFMDNVKARFFPFWASRVIDVKEEGVAEFDSSELLSGDQVDGFVADVCARIFAIGTNMSAINKNELKHAFEELAERYRDNLPHPGSLPLLATSKHLFSVEDWVKEFHGNTVVTLESELVWPIPKPLMI